MGLGRFGGGLGAVKWLTGQGAGVLLTDCAAENQLAEPLAAIADVIDSGQVTLRLGAHDETDFRAADLVVVSPAVPKPWKNPFVLAAAEAGARITTEIRLLVERLPNRDRIIAVTGTAGKSTTAAMIAHILRARAGVSQSEGRVWLGGNIGGSLLPRCHEISPEDTVVLELSSAMLYWLGDWFVGRRDEAGWSPRVAAVTNVLPNHLDWHGDFDHYEQCKRNIFIAQTPGDALVLGHDSMARPSAQAGRDACPTDREAWGVFLNWCRRCAAEGRIVDHEAGALIARKLRAPGLHNALNACVAEAAAQSVGLTDRGQRMLKQFVNVQHHAQQNDVDAADSSLAIESSAKENDALMSFRGLPHRLQIVAEAKCGNGVIRAVNDSKATTPEAAALGVRAVIEMLSAERAEQSSAAGKDRPGAESIHLLAGGYDKGVDLAPMIPAAARCHRVYTIGATGPKLAFEIHQNKGAVVHCGDLDTALEQAAMSARPGDVILLSPGCASWDQFKNYEERGRRFVERIRRLLRLDPAPESLFAMPPEVIVSG